MSYGTEKFSVIIFFAPKPFSGFSKISNTHRNLYPIMDSLDDSFKRISISIVVERYRFVSYFEPRKKKC